MRDLTQIRRAFHGVPGPILFLTLLVEEWFVLFGELALDIGELAAGHRARELPHDRPGVLHGGLRRGSALPLGYPQVELVQREGLRLLGVVAGLELSL